MTGKEQGSRDIFRRFSADYVPQIDSLITGLFEQRIASSDAQFMKDMYASVSEFCLRDGKRIRPLMLLNSFNGYRRGFGSAAGIIKLATAVELMHSFLLVQDDIIDRSELRRGRKSLHILMNDMYGKFSLNPAIGTDIASVLADVIFSCAVDLVAAADVRSAYKNRFLQVFSKTYEMTAWGQILDSLCTMPSSIDPQSDAPMRISLMKTAYYTMVYPMIMGYVLSGGRNEREKKRIEDFGVPLGVAFQVRDDLLGVFGVEGDTGKPNDSDIKEGKFTLLVQNAVASLQGSERAEFTARFLKPEKSELDVEYIRSMIIDSGAMNDTITRHRELIDEARIKLDELALTGRSREVLCGVIESVEDIPV
ncbi:MAG TPA: polyprenyl synthetase family protein [Spirochaetota bacterium]|nr:polyprenyl synthetase family protein [Spirochaetota bacterium]HQO39751.1 polyprenyl synthetase family protein [Spirochaetota bacterium]